MGLDWFTFVAQILNFVILLFLLKRFLYRPVLDTIARREQGIRDRLEEAQRLEEDAASESRRLREERVEIEARRSELLDAAEREAAARGLELAEEVGRHAEKVREDWRDSLARQQETFLQELRTRISKEAYSLAGTVVRDLADAELEAQVIRVFLKQVRSMDEDERAEFLAALDEADGRLGIRTAFLLTPEHRDRIAELVRDWTGSDPEVHFETEPNLALGIEMRAGDRKAGWSVGSYLEALEARTREFLETQDR